MLRQSTKLLLIYQRAGRADGSIQQITNDERLHKLKTSLHQVSEQLTALSTQGRLPKAISYAKPPRELPTQGYYDATTVEEEDI